jgi:hypothetical protein
MNIHEVLLIKQIKELQKQIMPTIECNKQNYEELRKKRIERGNIKKLDF